ncbi:MAG: Gfo/Idh/MocA family oxidoreductase [Spirochaetes bacterium]|nr:Gfo/Idh/MocA family oxidoreductase [Spirochaetota bacterium]MBU1079789.1 Gfo/Idh/MocA family oxidoreductase [Spirochaetota bacterium]
MRLGIVGSGMIAEECLRALPRAEGVRPIAICAREGSRSRAQALASAHGSLTVYTDYGEMLERAGLDAVYVGISNDLHYDYARRALESGIGAIVEKPFTVTLAEAQSLSSLARSRGLFLFEAVPTAYSPVFRDVVDSARELGPISLVDCAYSQRSSRYDRYLAGDVAPVFDPSRAGGALRDLNVYNIHFAVALLGRPDSVSYAARRGWNGVDVSGAAVLGYEGATAVCAAAKDADGPSFSSAQGEAGWLRVDGSPNGFSKAEIVGRGRPPLLLSDDSGLPRMAHEWIAFERMLRTGDLDECYRRLERSLDVMSVLERASASLGGSLPRRGEEA